MPLNFTAAHSSRITKPRSKKPPPLLRTISSPFDSHRRTKSSPKPGLLARSLTELGTESPSSDVPDDPFDSAEPLPNHGVIKCLPLGSLVFAQKVQIRKLATANDATSLHDIIANAQAIIFSDLPTERTGMNSTRISAVLRFQRDTPRLVTLAHVHAKRTNPTATEREIAALVTEGKARRISVPRRGTGKERIGDCVILKTTFDVLLEHSALSVGVKERFQDVLRAEASATTVTLARLKQGGLDTEAVREIMTAGFLTAVHEVDSAEVFSRQSVSNTQTSVVSIARSASGSLEAVGGRGAINTSGGGGIGSLSSRQDPSMAPLLTLDQRTVYRVSVPGIGSYLKLLHEARTYLITLLSKSKYGEAPLNLLKERWDGHVSITKRSTHGKDPFGVVLPGKLKKWKDFNGISFEWVLAECMGAGLVEVFDTKAVGLGVRIAG